MMNNQPSEIIVLISHAIDAPLDWLSFRMCSKLFDACSLVGDQAEKRKVQAARRLQEKIFAPVFALFNEAKRGIDSQRKLMPMYSQVYNMYVMNSKCLPHSSQYPLPFDIAYIAHFNADQYPVYESISFILVRIEEEQPATRKYLEYIFMYMIGISRRAKYINYVKGKTQ